jgi:hypothetical protein
MVVLRKALVDTYFVASLRELIAIAITGPLTEVSSF